MTDAKAQLVQSWLTKAQHDLASACVLAATNPPLLAPLGQVGRVQPFATEQRTDLPTPCAPVDFFQYAQRSPMDFFHLIHVKIADRFS